LKKISFGALMTILMGVIWLCLPVTPVAAQTTQTLQVKATITSSSQWLPVGDEDGHVIGMGKGEGEAVLSNGETAKYSNVSTFDPRRGKGGTSEGYTRFIFSDGSGIVFYWTARITVGQDGLSSSEGEGIITKGTGRFEGIEGTSVFSSKVQLSQDSKRITVADATITYTLP
jgi:hypothetical protein